MMAKAGTKAKKQSAPEPEVDEVDDELEEIDDDTEEAPAKGKKSTTPEVTFGASDLAKYLSEKSGKNVTPRELRTLIRKMARDGSGRVTREIVQGNRSRYNWSGPNDPEVKQIIKAFEGGELEADKQEKLAKLKADKAAKKAAGEPVGKKARAKAEKEAAKKKGKKGKKAQAVVEDEDEDLELDDDE